MSAGDGGVELCALAYRHSFANHEGGSLGHRAQHLTRLSVAGPRKRHCEAGSQPCLLTCCDSSSAQC